MTATPYETVTTPNMLEIAYLLERHHTITRVTTQAGWPYGIEELAVTLAGENINVDHRGFCRHGEFCLNELPELTAAFSAVMATLARQAKDDKGGAL